MTRRHHQTSKKACRHSGCTHPRTTFIHFRDEVDNGERLFTLSRYCGLHSCGQWAGRDRSVVCCQEKSKFDEGCEAHMRLEMQQDALAWSQARRRRAAAASEHTNYAEARYVEAPPVFDYQETASAQQATPQQALPTCEREGCQRVVAEGSSFCATHGCRIGGCGENRYEHTKWCMRHQKCLHSRCHNFQVVNYAVRLGGLANTSEPGREGYYSPSTLKGYCEDHHACGDQGDNPDHVCDKSISQDRKYCEDHQCQGGGCRERRWTWKFEDNPFCESHTCHVDRACRSLTRNTAEERRWRYCVRHTCATQNCFNRRAHHHGNYCEWHSFGRERQHMGTAWTSPEGEPPPPPVQTETGGWANGRPWQRPWHGHWPTGQPVPPEAFAGPRRYYERQNHHEW